MSDGQRAYEAYNAGGDPATAGLNFRGDPCPAWADLPDNVRAKWDAAAAELTRCGSTCPHGDRCRLEVGHEYGHNHRCECNEPNADVVKEGA